MDIRPAIRQLTRKSFEEESEPQKGDILDCALGRNFFGTSEKVVKLAKHYDWSQLWDVPDTSYKDLKRQICRFWSGYADLKIENIKVANGSAVFLSRFLKLFIEPGVKVLGYIPQFEVYHPEIAVLGGKYESVLLDPQENFRFNLHRFLNKITPDYSIVFIDNPNNPTGQFISLSDIETIIREAAKKEIIVIIDEAYGDYVEEKYSAVNLFNNYQNIVVTRTFTKGYGIGQFRVGYAILSTELGDYYNRIELPFSVSAMGAVLASEALVDQDFLIKMRHQVKAEKEKLTKELSKRGYLFAETCDSCPLFIMRHKDKDIDLKEYLLSKRILTTPGIDWENLNKNWVRVNTPRNAEDFLARLER
jgi:histidinol-phosphate aminotransferase